MHHPSSRHLALVESRPEPDCDPEADRNLDEARFAPALAQRVEEILGQRRSAGAADATHPTSPAVGQRTPAHSLPFAVHLTMVQILEIAEDAEIRAEIIDDVASTLDPARDGAFIRRPDAPDQIERRVDCLQEIARDLRGIAAQIIDRWTASERSS